MDCKQPDEFSRVVIINNGNFSFGVIVDKVSHVVGVKKELLKESSTIANSSRTDYVKGIFNLNNGKRLVMLLEPSKLISIEEAKGIEGTDHNKTVYEKSVSVDEEENNHEHIVVFKLDEEEYGIEISNVQEINRMSRITHFPGSPAFIAGMVDLRGDIIPILNLRTLFLFNDNEVSTTSKFLVVEFKNRRIGILIDSASEVLRFSKVYLEDAPEVFKGNDDGNYIDKIAKLNAGKRTVLILDLSTLLSFL
jgi:purine-binding chemotaxis protein CheW